MPAKKKKPSVHKDMDGLELYIDEFGEIKMTKPQEEINSFLNKHTDDKKIQGKKEKKKS